MALHRLRVGSRVRPGRRSGATGTRRPAAALAALVLLLAGCGEGGGSGSADGDGLTHITVAALPLTDSAALYLARDRGLFEKEGLSVRIQPVQQSIQALPALSKGQVDVIASANYVTFLQAHEKGTLDLRILAEGVRTAPHMMDVLVPRDSGIKSVADLAGKKVAVNILNNIQSLTLDAILDRQGVGRPVYRQIAFPQMGPALERNQVDAVHAVEPFDSAIQGQLKARVLLDGATAPVRSLPISGYVTTGKFATGHAKAAASFRRAIEAASKIASTDPSAVRAELPEYTKVTAEQARTIHLPSYPATADAAQLRRLAQLMKKQGLLQKDIDPATLLVK
ncbi:NitT/TauT family transport system substrate-binding protein [Streptomyces sp. SLBN-31]|nr:NitT/TauT family transport system substrate-binding protein [Streptomyces sp. SLBN-31]